LVSVAISCGLYIISDNGYDFIATYSLNINEEKNLNLIHSSNLQFNADWPFRPSG